MSELNFSGLGLIEVPFTGPDGKPYILKEATGKAAAAYRDASMAAMTFGPNGKVVGIKDTASIELQLVADCTYNDKGQVAGIAIIQKWPARVTKVLFAKVKAISELNETETPLREALEKAFARPDAPITFAALSQWADGLPRDVDELQAVRDLLAEAPAKNAPAGSTAGSELAK